MTPFGGVAGRVARRAGVCLLLLATAACGGGEVAPGETPAGAPSSPAAAPSVAALDPVPGWTFDRELLDQDRHAYRLPLAAGTYVELVAEQRGVDAVLTLFTPDGRRLIRVDSPTGPAGEERLRAVTPAAGEHRLEVAAPWRTGTGGVYTLTLETLRPATAADRRRFAADRLFTEAEELREAGDAESARRALELYERAGAAAEALGDRLRHAHVQARLGWILRKHLDRKRAALRPYRRAAALFGELGMAGEQAEALNGLGRVHYELGEMAAAAECYRRALPLWRRAGDEAGEAAMLNNLALIYFTRGDVREARDFYDRAVARLGRLDQPENENRALYNRGQFYRSLGKEREALDDLGRALEQARRAGAPADEAAALAAIGEVREQMGEPQAAHEVLLRALELRRELGRPRGIARALRSLASVDTALGRRGDALRRLREALHLFHGLDARRDEAPVLARLGWLLVADGRPGEAVEPLQAALALFTDFEQPDGEALALLGLARARRELGDPDAARELAERGLDRIEEVRLGAVSHDLRATYFARQQDHYDFVVDLLMELHRHRPGAGFERRALAVSERSRARSLVDVLVESGIDPRSGADPALLRREEEVRRRLAALEIERTGPLDAELDAQPSAEHAAARERELRRLLRELDAVRARIRAASPRYAALTRPRPPGADDLQRRVVDEGTLLLEYDLGAQRSYLWLVGPGSVSGHVLPARDVIETAARRAHELLVASRGREAAAPTRRALETLGEMLLGPVADRLGDRRLLVVADGALHYVPFAALRLRPPGAGGASVPVVAGHEVVQMASASALTVLREQVASRPPAPGVAAVLADPVFSAADPRLPSPSSRPDTGGDALPRLHHSPREAAAIRALVPAADRLVAVGFDARRELVTGGDLGRFRIVHLATHGEINDEHPELSRLVLSRFDAAGRRRDGRLFAHEISTLHLPADLVVLSACRTALGAEIRGEGLVGLTQAFFHAGAARVLVSLWPVDDRATAELMSHFYRALLRDGRPPAAALRQAQLAVQGRPGWSAPYDWAGFVLQGDWRGSLAD